MYIHNNIFLVSFVSYNSVQQAVIYYVYTMANHILH